MRDKSKIQLDICRVFNIDIEAMACTIEQVVGQYLKDAPKGIFTPARLEPAMVDGGSYFFRKVNPSTGLVENIPLNNLDDAPPTNVFSSDRSLPAPALWSKLSTPVSDRFCRQTDEERVVIPKIFMTQKKKFLSNQPILPYKGIKAIEAIVEDYVNSHVQYPRSVGENGDRVFDQFKTEYLQGDYHSNLDPIILYLESVTEELTDTLRRFMQGFEWHLYFIRIKGSRLTVEMSVDQRAYLWMLEEEKAMIIKQTTEELRG